MPTPTIVVKRLPHAEGLPLPSYQSAGAAGMDLPAAVPADEPLVLAPGARFLVPTGFLIAIPSGFEGQVRPRSGLAIRYGITLPNAPGTIDSDYRGEILVPMMNLGQEPFTITRGMRVAQLLITPVVQ
ncbi:MAG: dUTP diphosphatase, partial [Methylobacteriaceae bacterium]|nr:dUTP diphosphatase [Methylobacteriaceae bacterium]